jgi:hypothetical protein
MRVSVDVDEQIPDILAKEVRAGACRVGAAGCDERRAYRRYEMKRESALNRLRMKQFVAMAVRVDAR